MNAPGGNENRHHEKCYRNVVYFLKSSLVKQQEHKDISKKLNHVKTQSHHDVNVYLMELLSRGLEDNRQFVGVRVSVKKRHEHAKVSCYH